jgi:hypothetical protein
MMKKLCPFLAGLLVYMGPSIPSACAESFAIQDGRLAGGGGFFWDSVPSGALGGVGANQIEFGFPVSLTPEIVQPGQQFTLTEIFAGEFHGEGNLVPSGHDADLFGTGDLRVIAAPVLAPAPRPSPGDFIFLTTTFSMSGVLAGTVFEAQPLAPHRPIASFRNEVFGHGSGTIELQASFETGSYEVFELFGTFEPGAPVPEPATVVLLGLGGVTLAVRASGRHKATRRFGIRVAPQRA